MCMWQRFDYQRIVGWRAEPLSVALSTMEMEEGHVIRRATLQKC